MNRNSYGYINCMIGWTSGIFAFGDRPIWAIAVGFIILLGGFSYMTLKHSDDPKCAKCVDCESGGKE